VRTYERTVVLFAALRLTEFLSVGLLKDVPQYLFEVKVVLTKEFMRKKFIPFSH